MRIKVHNNANTVDMLVNSGIRNSQALLLVGRVFEVEETPPINGYLSEEAVKAGRKPSKWMRLRDDQLDKDGIKLYYNWKIPSDCYDEVSPFDSEDPFDQVSYKTI